jgi:hypothetical protein
MLSDEEADELKRAHTETMSWVLGLGAVLVEKGICTLDEIIASKVKGLAMLDQFLAELRNQSQT